MGFMSNVPFVLDAFTYVATLHHRYGIQFQNESYHAVAMMTSDLQQTYITK